MGDVQLRLPKVTQTNKERNDTACASLVGLQLWWYEWWKRWKHWRVSRNSKSSVSTSGQLNHMNHMNGISWWIVVNHFCVCGSRGFTCSIRQNRQFNKSSMIILNHWSELLVYWCPKNIKNSVSWCVQVQTPSLKDWDHTSPVWC